ncbi:MAG: single-stranded DNA-binding protein [Synergistaceae bacterium]|nr:single-stranded DNA-binding protein [Synergistaceae bacterium]
MRGLNRVIIAGNLTRDPEVRYTVNKRAFARFGVAVSHMYKDNNGEYKESTDFINVVAWSFIAERCGKYLKKGSPVLIEGRLRTSSYEARDGSGKRTMTEVEAINLIMLGSGKQGGNDDLSAVGDDSMDDGNFGSSIIEKGFDSVSPDDTGADIPF